MPSSRGRTAGFKMPEDHRDKIRNSNILSNLIKHCEGLRDMSQTQVTASLGLLKKCLPDLSAVTVAGDPDNPLKHSHAVEVTFVQAKPEDGK